MDQDERRIFLIKELIKENFELQQLEIPASIYQQQKLLRTLMNVRQPLPINEKFLSIQDEYLQIESKKKGSTGIEDLIPLKNQIYLWQGDITTLKVDSIVNAANSTLLGCFIPCHDCIDNCIHSNAGIQLRLACNELMKSQQGAEPAGHAKITSGYDLPAKYVIHTVGPIIMYDKVSEKDRSLLEACYLSCLKLADEKKLHTIAFCCISTGEFHFPNELAAKIAVNTVSKYLADTNSEIEVIFNVYKDEDYAIYGELLK